MDQHLNDTAESTFKCRACKQDIPHQELQTHKQTCYALPHYKCDYCDVVKSFTEITGVEPTARRGHPKKCHEDKCPNFPIPCPFGQQCGETIRRKDEDHLMKHIDPKGAIDKKAIEHLIEELRKLL